LKYFVKILTIFLISQTFGVVSAQTNANYKYPTHKFLQSADSLLCDNDTINAVKVLEDFVNKTNRTEITWKSKNACSPITDVISPSSIYADVCLEISDLSLRLNNPENAIKYINKLKDEYSPRFGGCLNGILMYETKISIYLANYYLHIGQKDEAIKTLAEYLIYQEDYSKKATEKLKALLMDEYSLNELRTIVNISIDNIELDGSDRPVIFLFGQRIILWPTSTIKDAKEFCRTNINLNKIIK
jgi:tetratricopeptide (TPR) repeat protein